MNGCMSPVQKLLVFKFELVLYAIQCLTIYGDDND